MDDEGTAGLLHSSINGHLSRRGLTTGDIEKQILAYTNKRRKTNGLQTIDNLSKSQINKVKKEAGLMNCGTQTQNAARGHACDSECNYSGACASLTAALVQPKCNGPGCKIIHCTCRLNFDGFTLNTEKETIGVKATRKAYKTELLKHEHSDVESDFPWLPEKLPPFTLTNENGSFPMGIKFVVATTKDRVGPVMAIVADETLDKEEIRVDRIPGAHPNTISDVILVACHSRAGNSALWNLYIQEVESFIDEILVMGDRLHLFDPTADDEDEYVRGAVLTMDGELQQLAIILGPETCQRLLDKNIIVAKHPSACSLAVQANDLGTMHRETKKESRKTSAEGVNPHIQNYLVKFGFKKIFKTLPSKKNADPF